jgi:hypothetical protein
MPWQAQLFIGVPVHDYDEARQILGNLGAVLKGYDDEILGETAVSKTVNFRGKARPITVAFMQESEGGCPFPVPKSEPYTDAIVGFDLTARYSPALLDEGHKTGRPEPFCFDPLEVADP